MLSGNLHRKSNKQFYFYALVFLWISVIVSCVADQGAARAGFVVNSSNPSTIFIQLAQTGSVAPLYQTVISLMGSFISEAILVRGNLFSLRSQSTVL
jgi:hypothetical protein